MAQMVLLVAREKTKISTAGKLSRATFINGFTMIELIVVISIITTLLVFSMPAFQRFSLVNDTSGQVADIIRLSNDLKKRAIEQDRDFSLHLDMLSSVVWVTHSDMDTETLAGAKEKGKVLSDQIEILDIEFPGKRESGAEDVVIRFYRAGYSDYAYIHIREGESDITLKIEPFLPEVQRTDTHVYLEDCN
jgi:prepilin-type N-terminal cleavage/methylation domain-containing protein